MKKILYAASILSCLSLAFAGSLAAEAYQRILAKVGTDIITSYDVEEALTAVRSKMDPAELQSAEGKKKLKELRHTILEKLVDDKLLIQEALRGDESKDDKEKPHAARPNPYLPKEEEVDEAVSQAFDEMRLRFRNDREFRTELERERITEQGLKTRLADSIRNQMILSRIMKAKQKEIQGSFNVTQGEAQAYYAEHASQFSVGDQVEMSQIVIAGKNPGGEALAGKLKERAVAGEDFASLAKKYSEDEGSRATGGRLGWIEKGQLKYPELEKAAFRAPLGKVTGPVHTRIGWHLILVEERKQASRRGFEEVKGQVMNYLYQKKMGERLEAWVQDLKQKTFVEISD